MYIFILDKLLLLEKYLLLKYLPGIIMEYSILLSQFYYLNVLSLTIKYGGIFHTSKSVCGFP